jgi:hypothetical protein
MAGLAAIGILDVWSIVANLHRASLAAGIESNHAVTSLRAVHRADHQVALSADVLVLAMIVVGTLFLCLLHQLVGDLHRMRPGAQRFSAGWAVGSWFVPFVNLVVPKQVVNDVWRASTPAGRRTS